MRVIGGEFRSRRLKSIPGDSVRPTPDRLRESLFSILMPYIDDAIFVDAYAGTGAIGIEAISRGAREAIFIEKNHAAADVLRGNLESLGIAARGRLILGSAHLYIAKQNADIVFIDPPYPQTEEYDLVLEILGAAPPRLVIAQHSKKHQLAAQYGQLNRYRVLQQSDNALSFFRPIES
ncbi:MAG: 16S rRNA (guanine(966)-N(2))-methyltransferase RsmD [Candidatus Solibacter usitatus]|nr:16S rRNA (guanine(966)-N(2))-methyltransferase RsmD [Candidatus Solibacter usitatus]